MLYLGGASAQTQSLTKDKFEVFTYLQSQTKLKMSGMPGEPHYC